MSDRARCGDDLRGIPHRYWKEAAAARHRAVLLDYDGTLAPYRIARAEARPLRGVARVLTRLAARSDTTLAIVSGRPISELRRLLPGLAAHWVGEHGWELQPRGSAVVQRALPKSSAASLTSALHSAAAAGFAKRLERKRAAVVVHLRDLPPPRARIIAREVLNLWRPCVRGGSLILRRTNGGVELRAAGRTKGAAVRELLESAPETTLPLYVGDDETDEDVFREIRGSGLAVWVGSSRNAAAPGWLQSCAGVRAFLQELERVIDGA